MRHLVLLGMDGPFAEWEPEMNSTLLSLDPDFPVIEPSEWREFSVYSGLTGRHHELVQVAYRTPGFYARLAPVAGAREALEGMAKVADIAFCSKPDANNPTCESDKKNWLAQHLDPYWTNHLILTPDKTGVKGDLLIDDHPQIGGRWEPEWEQAIFDKPYNQETKLRLRIASDWSNWEEVFQEAGIV